MAVLDELESTNKDPDLRDYVVLDDNTAQRLFSVLGAARAVDFECGASWNEN